LDNIQISYPGHFLFFILLGAIVYALSLYFKDKRVKENKSWLPSVLGAFRFLSVLGILFLLLTPLFKNFITEKQKPIIVIATDKSESVKLSTPSELLNNVNTELSQLSENWKEDYDIVNIEFGTNMVFNADDSIDIQSTNLANPLEYISDAYEDQNLGAVIVASDGIYNEGKNPLYADLQFTAPVYTIPLGDTTIRTDILIKNVLHNRIVYLNDRFIIEADVQAYNSKGSKSNISLYKVSNGKQSKIETQNFTIDKQNYFNSFQFELEADQIGNTKYFVSVGRINNEISTTNNSRNLYIEILDARQKILLLANATHPDIKAIKDIVNSNKNYEVEVMKASDPLTSINKYDVVILHNLPSKKEPITTQMAAIEKYKKPVLFILGADTDLNSFNTHQEVLTVQGGNSSLNDITPILENEFSLFTLSDRLKAEVESFIPLKVPFGEYKTSASANTLLYQQIGNVPTQYPLLSYSDLNSHRQAVLAGEGIWRWRLMEYLEDESQELSKEILLKTIQFISKKEDKRQFRAFSSKNAYKENEQITFDAQLYNENFESINNTEAELTITNESGEKFEYTFSKTNDYYFLEVGRFPEGNYRFNATTVYNGKNLNAGGKFSVQSILKEQFDLTAKHDLLYSLSDKFGGKVVYPNELNSLSVLIADNKTIKPVLYQKAETKPLLNLKWILGVLIFFLVVEWFFRRYFGGY